MKHFILNQHFKLCWLSPCKTGTPHRIKKTQFPMSLGSYTSYIDHKKLLVVEILCPCWVFPQYTQLQLSCFYTHYPLISKWILMACLWSSIQFPTFSLHWSLPVLCPSQCIPFFYWWTLRRIERWDEFNTHLFPHPTCKWCSWCWTTLCPPFTPLLSEAQGADLPHVACQGVSLPGIISPLPEAHLHFKLSVRLRTSSPDCLWTLAIVPFSSLSDYWFSHHISWFGYCILIEVQRRAWKLMELLSHVTFPQKEPPPPHPP